MERYTPLGHDLAAGDGEPEGPAKSIQVESTALYWALTAGALGAVFGLIIGLALPSIALAGTNSFGMAASIASGVAAAATAAVAYRRMRGLTGQEWRRSLSTWTFTVNTIAVVLVHAVLAALATLAVYLIIDRSFIGAPLGVFWSVVLMAVTVGITTYFVYLSVSKITTRAMSTLLLWFVTIGTFTATLTASDPLWWEIHFSHLGTFRDLSGYTFNGTLVVGGMLVTTFAAYVTHDLRALVARGCLTYAACPRIVSTLFVAMGVFLAGVGLVPVDISLLVHNLFAMGLAVVYLGLLVSGPKVLRGMPRAYFLASWAFLAALLVSLALTGVRFFGITAFEIIVFALIFGWITVFIRFSGVADLEK
ncbi:MAG: hypothetical protein Q4P15_00135 [Propionibacteriaceae bacterium]|nr:hypothetical protein [Propionibacteriaceae bacterium]